MDEIAIWSFFSRESNGKYFFQKYLQNSKFTFDLLTVETPWRSCNSFDN